MTDSRTEIAQSPAATDRSRWESALALHDVHGVSVLELAEAWGVRPEEMLSRLDAERDWQQIVRSNTGGSAMAVTTPEADPFESEGPSAHKGKRREYIVLREVDGGRFEPMTWFEDRDGYIVSAETPGAELKTSAWVPNPEAALAVGFTAAGEPADGIRLVAVAALHFQAKTVQPRPVERRKPTPSRLTFA